MKGEGLGGGGGGGQKGLGDPLLTAGAGGDQQQYQVYSTRWLMLIIFSILSITNAMMWITFAPISDDASDYFGGYIPSLIPL